MFNLKRNQVIITVLIFMIAIAAYLNTQETPMSFQSTEVANSGEVAQPEEIDFFSGYDEQLTNPTQVADATQPTDATQVADSSQVNQVSEEGLNNTADLSLQDATDTQSISATITKKSEEALTSTEVAASKNIEVSYFAEEKLLREQSRAQQVEQLTEYVANENLDQDAKSKAAANLIEIQERIEKENSAEALLKAKGFSEVYVRIDDDTVDVVVNKAELTDSEIAQIEEIVNRKTGYSVGKINITPLNGVANK